MVDRQIMAKRIYIKSGSLQLEATLNDTDLAASLWSALPISAPANTWGDEIYFGIPVDAELENAQEVVDLGDLAYWPPGRAFCVFSDPLRPAGETKSVPPPPLRSSEKWKETPPSSSGCSGEIQSL